MFNKIISLADEYFLVKEYSFTKLPDIDIVKGDRIPANADSYMIKDLTHENFRRLVELPRKLKPYDNFFLFALVTNLLLGIFDPSWYHQKLAIFNAITVFVTKDKMINNILRYLDKAEKLEKTFLEIRFDSKIQPKSFKYLYHKRLINRFRWK